MKLSVGPGDSLELVLLLDGVRVRRSLSGVDELVGKTLGNGFRVVESGFTGADGEEGDGLVDTSEWGDIDGLSSDGTLGSDSGGVFSWASVDNGVDEDLDWVLLGDEVDDLESVLDDSDGHDLFTVVSSVHHEGVDQSLNDGHSSLGELLLGVSASSVGNVDGMVDVDVVGQGDVLDLDLLRVPFAEELNGSLVSDLLDVVW